MEIVETKRGGKKIIFDDFVYVKQKLVKVGIRWNRVKNLKTMKIIVKEVLHLMSTLKLLFLKLTIIIMPAQLKWR
jgi:hypothetical protein